MATTMYTNEIEYRKVRNAELLEQIHAIEASLEKPGSTSEKEALRAEIENLCYERCMNAYNLEILLTHAEKLARYDAAYPSESISDDMVFEPVPSSDESESLPGLESCSDDEDYPIIVD